jgi:peptidoglycan/xylan/chitin deacetylase (PgdA/CDA1 family)
MSYLPTCNAVLGSDWDDLAAEFDRWHEAGRTALLWWRDDDATAPTPLLEMLLQLADGVPLALAVIPASARPELARTLERAPAASVVQHGWLHRNHSESGGKKSEYGPGRPQSRVAAEIAAGRTRLAAMFGRRVLPVFVPPWNHIAPEYMPLLAESGVRALSAMASSRRPAPESIARIDIGLDLVDWHRGRGFIGREAALGGLIAGLQAMRTGLAAAPAFGILTHHAVMDRAGAAFLARLVEATRSHAAASWAGLPELLPEAPR